MGADAGDPLTFLVEHRDVVEWARLAAAAATPLEWRVIVTFAKTEGTSADVAKELGDAAEHRARGSRASCGSDAHG